MDMSNTATLKDNHLYITYESYPGYDSKIIPVENIECIKANVGVRGGMHTWSLRGHEERYANIYEPRDVPIFSGDRKSTDLIEKIMVVLPDLKYVEKVENGGAPW
jgi:hypothetical protein